MLYTIIATVFPIIVASITAVACLFLTVTATIVVFEFIRTLLD